MQSALSVYVHLPWCVQKCPYCDFNSHTLKQTLPEQAYINKLLVDLQHDISTIKDRHLHSIFIGGGTPSLFSGAAIKQIIDAIYDHLNTKTKVEVTLEANPGTVDIQHFEDYLTAGVNRLSLGVQSFHDVSLKKLGRIHDASKAKQAFQLARKVGFDNINIDLMFGLPEQEVREGLSDLHTAIALQPEHISWYQLTLEPNTPFYHSPPTLPSHDAIYALYQQGFALLETHGYQAYEVSAYAKPGRQCQHNRQYWRYGDYLGIGAGAHGKITDLDTFDVFRTRKHQHPQVYLRSDICIAEKKPVLPDEKLFEYLLNHLRLYEPVAFSHMELATRLSREQLIQKAKPLVDQGFLSMTDEMLILTVQGRHFLDDVMAHFLP